MFASTLNPLKILRHLGKRHPPIVKRLRNLRRVIGNPVFGQSSPQRSIHKGLRLAFRVATEWRMGVIISWHVGISG
jgi:hypothetical protein